VILSSQFKDIYNFECSQRFAPHSYLQYPSFESIFSRPNFKDYTQSRGGLIAAQLAERVGKVDYLY